ncbi:hypothetical protein GEW_11861, partial [Pasteurella multocida subsp. gallicida str. Anand1_poultry]
IALKNQARISHPLNKENFMLAKLIDFLLCRFTSFITGCSPTKERLRNNLQEKIDCIMPIIIVTGILYYFGCLYPMKYAKYPPCRG